MADLWWIPPSILVVTGGPMIVSEIKSRTIPDWTTLLSIAALAAYYVLFDQRRLLPGIAGGCLGLTSLFLLHKLKPLGLGDVKYAFALGLLTGWQRIFPALGLSSIFALGVILPLWMTKKIDSRYPFPFGPFLLAGGVTVSLPVFDQFFNFTV